MGVIANRLDVGSQQDTIPPDPVTDLVVKHIDGDWVELQWTATGDDGSVGTATYYDVRYSTAPITESNYRSASYATPVPRPQVAGSTERCRVHKLGFTTTYYFAVKVIDEYINVSTISNVTTAATLPPPDISVAPESLSAYLFPGQTETDALTISNTGPSELRFDVSVRTVEPTALTPSGRVGAVPGPTRALSVTASPSIRRTYHGRRALSRQMGMSENPRHTSDAAGGIRILLIHSGVWVTGIRDQLAQFPDVATVDVLDGELETPTPMQLDSYDVVIAFANTQFGEPAALGDVLADYVDDGGGVILTLATFISGWEITGRFLAEGYGPFHVGTGPDGDSWLGWFDRDHPIMRDVTAAYGGALGVVNLMPGARLVAEWAGYPYLPFVAISDRRVVGVNVYIGYQEGDSPLILHNAARWVSTPDFLRVEPQTGSVPPGGSIDVAVTFDAARLSAGDYFGELRISSNDPGNSVTTVAATLHVTEPTTGIELALVSASAEPGRARLTWRAGDKSIRATVQRHDPEGEWLARAEIEADGEGYLRYEDTEVRAGQRYGYRLVVQDGEASRTMGETWVEVASGVEFALAGPRPHPARGELAVAFSLPDARRATLELLDLAGRRVRALEVGERGPGRHLVTLGRTERLPAGIYLIRLERGGQALTTKCVIMQ